MQIKSKRSYRVAKQRRFSTYYRLRLPSHQEEMFKKIEDLEKEYNNLDREVEELKEVVKDNEVDYMEEDEVSELSKAIDGNTSRKDKLAGNIGELRDRTLFDEGKVRAEKSLILQEVNALAKKDLKILQDIKSNIPEEDKLHGMTSDLIDKLEAAARSSSDLHKELHSRDLPRFPQDSTDVNQTDFTSFEPFDD